MRKIVKLGIAVVCSFALHVAKADDPQSYALDKLANAQAQLGKLEAQKKALNELIRAVKQDLRAAKIRTKAERLQVNADTKRQDAVSLVQQAGVAVDLPNLMATKGTDAGVMEYANKEDIDLMFKDKQKQQTVFFPGGDKGRKLEIRKSGIDNDSDLRLKK